MLSVEHESEGSGEDSGFIPQRLTVKFHFLATHQARRTLVPVTLGLVHLCTALQLDQCPPFHSLCIIPEIGHGIGTR